MKLFIDHQIFSLQRFGGISRYFSNIVDAAENHENVEANVGLLYTQNYYLRNQPALLNNSIGRLLLRKQRKNYKWNQKYCKYILTKNRHDIFHPSYYDPYFLSFNKKPFVITVHDMIHERMPEYFSINDSNSRNKRMCVEHADHIIAISETTKQDLKDILNVKDDKITVIHHGFQMEASHHKDFISQTDSKQTGNYLLYVGDRSGYKNFPRLITALGDLLISENLSLICAGGGSFKNAEEELIIRLGIKDHLTQVNTSDEELSHLYQGAIAFVFPSLNEGFGLPILEAFSSHCPVIGSDIPCFREIGGNAMSYFDPLDVQSIYRNVKEVVVNENIRHKLIFVGNQKLEKYSMKDCISKTMKVYEMLAH